MILRRLRVHPFGRFADRAVAFAPGLTVVLGPNEAGKSTLLEALKAALFVPARLSKAKFEEYLGRFVPVEGGDVVRAEIAFSAGGGEYALARRWGPGAASELVAPGGGPLADEKAIAERVAALLPAPPRTVVSVLVVGQAALGATVEKLGAKGGLDDVSAVLRRVVQETGGVSVDAVRRKVGATEAGLYGRWDRVREAPEKGRGIENPWDRGAGAVLTAWYAAERLRAGLARAREYERALDELNRKIETAQRALDGHERFLRDHQAAFRDAGERRALEARLEAETLRRAALRRDADEWPVVEARRGQLDAGIAEADARLPALAAGVRAAEAAQAGAALREKAARVERIAARLAQAEAALAAAPVLDRAALAEIRAADREAERRGAAGGPVALRLAARAAVALELRRGGEPPRRIELAAGETRDLEAGPSFTLGLPGLDVTVGVAGADDLAGAVGRRSALLARHGVADAAAAEAACRAREEAAAERDRSRRDLDEELAGEELPALRARVAGLDDARPARPLKDALDDLAAARATLEAMRVERERTAKRIGDLAREHGDRDRLYAAMGGSAREAQELEARIAACAPLPAGFADAAAFVAAYERHRAERDAAKDDVNDLLRQRAAREAAAPDQSAEELEAQRRDAEAAFAAVRSRARAVERVVAAVEAVAGSDDALYAGLADEVAAAFADLSLGAHPGVVVRERLPVAVRTAGGAELPWEWLSAGARDLLGLAVRLAMARVVIGDAGGFLLLDDPLVDLDPARQAAAAAALRTFAATRQTVVFTCHPAHAELLGGDLVRLD